MQPIIIHSFSLSLSTGRMTFWHRSSLDPASHSAAALITQRYMSYCIINSRQQHEPSPAAPFASCIDFVVEVEGAPPHLPATLQHPQPTTRSERSHHTSQAKASEVAKEQRRPRKHLLQSMEARGDGIISVFFFCRHRHSRQEAQSSSRISAPRGGISLD